MPRRRKSGKKRQAPKPDKTNDDTTHPHACSSDGIDLKRTYASTHAKWTSVYGHVFNDRCSMSESKNSDRKASTRCLDSSVFSHPVAPGMSRIAHDLLTLDSDRSEIVSNRWLSRVVTKSTESGEIVYMTPGVENIDTKGNNASILITEKVSADVRTREYIIRQMAGVGKKPWGVQATFMMATAMMSASNVAGDEWKNVGPSICQEMGWPFKATYRMQLGSAPRRLGKTRSVSMSVLNYALSIPGVLVIVFSTSRDTSALMRKDVVDMMSAAGYMKFAGNQYKITDLVGSKDAASELRLRSPYDLTQESVIQFCPGLNKTNMDKQRGRGNHPRVMIVCEELAFWDPFGFANVVLPIMSMKNAIMLGISSPAYGAMNFFTRLQHITLPNSDQRVCLTVSAELACPNCKKRGLAAWCSHHNSMLPHWLCSQAQHRNRLIYDALNMSQAAERELGGITASGGNKAFTPKSIKKLRGRKLFGGETRNKPTHIGIFVDPNAGGGSDAAILSICVADGVFVVCLTFLKLMISGGGIGATMVMTVMLLLLLVFLDVFLFVVDVLLVVPSIVVVTQCL